jgi:hypothetical protein
VASRFQVSDKDKLLLGLSLLRAIQGRILTGQRGLFDHHLEQPALRTVGFASASGIRNAVLV